MFPPSTTPAAALAERVRELRELGEVHGGFAGRGDSAADLVVLLDELETLKCRAEGAQAMAAVALDTSVKAEQAAAGVPADRRGQGVGLQVALARRSRTPGAPATSAGAHPGGRAAPHAGGVAGGADQRVARHPDLPGDRVP
jgi:hypothetical protein